MKKIPRTIAELDGQEIDFNDSSYQLALTTSGVVRQIIGSNELMAAILTDPEFKCIIVDTLNVGDIVETE